MAQKISVLQAEQDEAKVPSYFAKAGQTAMGSGERLVCVTGTLYGGLLRVVDVDVQGKPVGSPSYLPASAVISEMVKDSEGYLIEAGSVDEAQEIDWEAHADKPSDPEADEATGTTTATVSSESGRINPAMAAFPELQED